MLAHCARWLIVVEGNANNDGDCRPYGCWWGENLVGHRDDPIVLATPNRVVLSPHVYGHGNHPARRRPSHGHTAPLTERKACALVC